MVKARKVGNSITVTIPKEVVSELAITEDTDMNVFVCEGAVVMEPATSRWDRLVRAARDNAAERGLFQSDVTEVLSDVRYGAMSNEPDSEADVAE